MSEADVLIICVPTPLNDAREPDLTYIESTGRQIAAALRPGQLVILESTTYPGTTRDVLVPILNQSGLRLGDAGAVVVQDVGAGLVVAGVPARELKKAAA